jgi:pSer/pThr/pTyr-binding forkhead associated (FHA) protein
MPTVPNIIVQLVHIAGPLKGEIQEISEPEIVIGRFSTCQVQFPKELAIISRRHATIIREGNRFRLTDESANGTYLNGKRVSQAHLNDGDVIMFAKDGPKLSFLTKIEQTVAPARTEHEKDPRPSTPSGVFPPLPERPPPSTPQKLDSHSSGSAASAPQKTKAPLVIQYGPTLQSYNELPITLGSHTDCDFVMHHPAVLQRHAQIFFSEDNYWIKDLTGKQSVLINNTPIDSQAILRPDDVLTLGNRGPGFRFLGGGRLAEIEQADSPQAADQVEGGGESGGLGKSKAQAPKKPSSLFRKFFSS